MRLQHLLIVVAAALAFQNGVSAQSLADVARAEEARRKAVKAGAKVYTNEDLGRMPEASPGPVQPTIADGNTAKPADTATKPEKTPVDPTKTEKYWKDRAVALQQSLARNKLLLEALQTQVNGMNAEYLSMDDPGHRGLLETRMQKATGELQRVQQDIEKQTKAAADLQDEARKAGVPAGWVR